ncbi:hypothetical protein GMPD_29660 [Geomonas paludis]|uniref:Uncharacterized protein n=1 Tax=Geomonas paludis TaxID=2740185 RepID=A0A6V8MZH9_9BACT|nr:hypothetical protein GMPD_29660 [Geomonas paludis]
MSPTWKLISFQIKGSTFKRPYFIISLELNGAKFTLKFLKGQKQKYISAVFIVPIAQIVSTHLSRFSDLRRWLEIRSDVGSSIAINVAAEFPVSLHSAAVFGGVPDRIGTAIS